MHRYRPAMSGPFWSGGPEDGMDLVSALAADSGVVCAVGAGGKKSTLYALAARLDRAVVTATVRIPIFDQYVGSVQVTEDPVSAISAASAADWPLGLVPERERSDRYRGYQTAQIDEIAAAGGSETVLVKADGARMREFKAPGEREPQLPECADTVLPIASVQAVGRPLDEETVHRPERVAEITGRAVGETIEPEDVAAVLASPDGGFRGVPDGATVIPVLNKVDDEALADVARSVAERVVSDSAAPRVVLAQMTADEPLVDVVE